MRLAQLQRSREDSDPTKVWRQKLRSTERMIGRSPAVAESLRHISVYALNDLPLLLLGPSGSGKTHAARIIHDNGPRRHGPYIELNCADLIRTLQATELFGTLKGTHSTATEDILGAVDRAAGGTLFLDELAELDLAVQSSLLKFIEQGIYSPGQGVVKKADVRVIIATNAQLEERVTEGRFRNDLFQRVKMFQIRFPGLAERREDILPLAEYFLGVYSSDQKLSLSPAAEEAILATEWPGNTRDLSNVVKRGLAFAKMEQAGQIEPRHLFPDERERPRNELSYQEQTRIFQRELLLRTLQATSWNISEAAKRLDITRAHVYNLINSFGLESGKKASSPARKG
jgi:Nif-specific regulatory protein